MTIKLRVTATLLNKARQPAAHQVVELQTLRLKHGWTGLSRTTSGAEGQVRIDVGLEGEGQLAPVLRLVRANADPVEVLAQQGAYKMARSLLHVAFGDVVLLPGSGVSAPTLHRLDRERVSGMNANLVDLLERRGEPLGRPAPSDKPSVDAVTDETLEGRKLVVYQEMLSAEMAKRERLQVQFEQHQERLEGLDTALTQSEQQRETLSRQLEQLRKSVSLSPDMDQLTTTVSSALDLARQQGGMQLATAELRIRGLVVEGGKRFHPLDSAEAREVLPDNVSELVLRLDPPRSKGTAQARDMPDLIGQTLESARRQALRDGLRLEVVEQPSRDYPEGAIIEQQPGPDATVDEAEGRVLVVVAVAVTNQENGDE